MSFAKNTLSVHLTDSALTIYRHGKGIVSGPFCCISKQPTKNDSAHDSLYCLTYPYRGSVVADFDSCKYIVNDYLHKALPRIHFHALMQIHVAISPVAGGIELRAVRDLFNSNQVTLYFEPVAFLYGKNRQDGIVISLNRTMLEVSFIKDMQITHFQWEYITEEVLKSDWESISERIIGVLKDLQEDLLEQSVYLIGEPQIVRSVYSILNGRNDFIIDASTDSNRIIVENVHLIQPIHY